MNFHSLKNFDTLYTLTGEREKQMDDRMLFHVRGCFGHLFAATVTSCSSLVPCCHLQDFLYVISKNTVNLHDDGALLEYLSHNSNVFIGWPSYVQRPTLFILRICGTILRRGGAGGKLKKGNIILRKLRDSDKNIY